MYLNPGDPDSFLDYPKRPKPEMGKPVECPKCLGHGGWNLKPFAYKGFLGKREDNSENRHKFVHFRAFCQQCNGWGWVSGIDATCVHEWEDKTTGNCLHLLTCLKCGTTKQADSSD